MFRNLFLFFIFCSAATATPVWQLGQTDKSSQEFKIQYFPWEYARIKSLPGHPSFHAANNTFCFKIPSTGILPKPDMVSGLSSASIKNWMFPDEVVSALQLEWDEKTDGYREITFHTTRFRNMSRGEDALELIMPDQTRKLFSIPVAMKAVSKDLALSAAFKVRQGKNTLLLRFRADNRHLLLNFDSITLQTASTAAVPSPNAEFSASNADYIFDPGEKGELSLKIWNCPMSAVLTYEIRDAFGKTVKKGESSIRNNHAILSLPTTQRGWYEVICTLPGGTKKKSAYAVLEPVQKEYIEKSRFGCHAVKGFSYLPSYWPEEQERKLHRAWRAGAKWVRLHGIKWALMQPSKDTPPDWTTLDARIAMLEKYKMGIMLQTGMTPKWASPTRSERLIPPIGVKEYQLHPPENEAWKRYISALTAHCRGKIHYYEIWNEPNFQSCFWLSGSPKDYARLIRTAYQAAKASDPNCKIVAGGLVDAHVFLEETLKANQGKAWFDVMAFHYVIRSLSYDRWRQVLREYPSMPLFNSEESWWNSDDPLEFASKVVKGHVIEAANGVQKTFAFNFFDNRAFSPQYGSVNGDGTPLPAYAAYRTMTHRLEKANYIGSLTGGKSPLKLHLFLRDKTPVIVGWTDGKAPVRAELFPETKIVSVVDLMDRETPLVTQNGRTEITFTSTPCFIEGGDAAWLTRLTELRRTLPDQLNGKAGTTLKRTLSGKIRQTTDFRLTLPETWTGSIKKSSADRWTLNIQIPENAAPGNHSLPIVVSENGKNARFQLSVKVSSGNAQDNLLRNGDFAQNGKNAPAFWYKGGRGTLTFLPGGGINGTNACRGENSGNGGVFWGSARRIKVSAGEEYLLSVTAKGEKGTFGIICTITDANGKKLSPLRPGINMLNSRTSADWKVYHDTIHITHPDAAYMNIALLVNHASKGSVTFDNISLYALNERYPAAKRLWKGVCKKAAGPVTADGNLSEWKDIPAMQINRREEVRLTTPGSAWSGEQDLSASLKMMRDAQNLYLAIEVRDDTESPRFPVTEAWKGDSVQLAFDPLLAGQDFSDLLLAETPEGKPVVWRYRKFWTPELLTGITATGELKSAKLAVRRIPGGKIWEAVIPLRELYPLTAASTECGFSFLVNDNDGKGRKLIEWSSGIGGKKNPKAFGLLLLEK